jgi:hypothetical protein
MNRAKRGSKPPFLHISQLFAGFPHLRFVEVETNRGYSVKIIEIDRRDK